MTHATQKGFTLIEMLMVLAIFSMLTAITVFNYTKFRSDTILTNMAYEVALSVREAQVYGVSARVTQDGATPSFDIPFGIYVVENSNQYYLFADNDGDDEFGGTTCMNAVNDTCITPYTLQQNIMISDISFPNGSGRQCPTKTLGTNYNASILFKRPNPEPVISTNVGGVSDPAFAQIQLKAPNGSIRYVIVYNNGQITVDNEPECE